MYQAANGFCEAACAPREVRRYRIARCSASESGYSLREIPSGIPLEDEGVPPSWIASGSRMKQ